MSRRPPGRRELLPARASASLGADGRSQRRLFEEHLLQVPAVAGTAFAVTLDQPGRAVRRSRRCRFWSGALLGEVTQTSQTDRGRVVGRSVPADGSGEMSYRVHRAVEATRREKQSVPMRNLQRNENFLFAAFVAVALLAGATDVSAGESQLASESALAPIASWSEGLSPTSIGSTDTDGSRAQEAGPAPAGLGETVSAKSGDTADNASDGFVPLLATEQSQSLAAARGIADSASAGLLDPESSGNPAVVPLPASVWAGLAVLLTTVWLGRHSKRRLRLPI